LVTSFDGVFEDGAIIRPLPFAFPGLFLRLPPLSIHPFGLPKKKQFKKSMSLAAPSKATPIATPKKDRIQSFQIVGYFQDIGFCLGYGFKSAIMLLHRQIPKIP
jgi:hypothetical protein